MKISKQCKSDEKFISLLAYHLYTLGYQIKKDNAYSITIGYDRKTRVYLTEFCFKKGIAFQYTIYGKHKFGKLVNAQSRVSITKHEITNYYNRNLPNKKLNEIIINELKKHVHIDFKTKPLNDTIGSIIFHFIDYGCMVFHNGDYHIITGDSGWCVGIYEENGEIKTEGDDETPVLNFYTNDPKYFEQLHYRLSLPKDGNNRWFEY